MTKKEFVDKWAWKYVHFSRTMCSAKEEFEKDLNDMLNDKSTRVYIPGSDDETDIYNPGGWFTVTDHT